MNYVLDCSNFEVRMIDRTILKVENSFKYKYNQQYVQSNTIKSNIINITAKAIQSKQYN